MLRYSRTGVVNCWSSVPLSSHGDSTATGLDGLATGVGEPVLRLALGDGVGDGPVHPASSTIATARAIGPLATFTR